MSTHTPISSVVGSKRENFIRTHAESDSSDSSQDFILKRGIRQRMCVVTRMVLPENKLLRCVVHPWGGHTVEIVPDPQRVMPGRGAWIQPDPELFRVAGQRKALQRALKVPVTAGIEKVRDYLETLDNPGDRTHDE